MTPRSDELVVRLAPNQLSFWARALASTIRPHERDVLALRWATRNEDVVLTLNGMRIVLFRVDEPSWHEAVEQAVATRGLIARASQGEKAIEATDGTDSDRTRTCLGSLAPQLSATLRRIGLLAPAATGLPTIDMTIVEHRGSQYLLDSSAGRPSAVPLWSSLSVPLDLWPAGPSYLEIPSSDPYAAVVRAVSSVETWEGNAAQALCHLAGLSSGPLELRAAHRVLEIAEAVLADPAYASVFDNGGWAGNCRRYEETTTSARDAEPVLPPGTEQLLDRNDVDLSVLGRMGFLDDVEIPTPEELAEFDLAAEGQLTLVRLLNWALAAATRPRSDAWNWAPDTVSRCWKAHRTLDHPLGVIELRVRTDRDTSRYSVFVSSASFGEQVAREWESASAPSAAAAVLAAEHAAIEAGAGMRYERDDRKQRLLLPEDVPTSVDPSIHELILAAHDDLVLDFEHLAAVLMHLRYRFSVSTGATDGHWQLEPDIPDAPVEYHYSFSARVCELSGLPGTDQNEPANTSPVDGAAYRRHLAVHRAALDPYVTCYLAAADRAAGEHQDDERHRAGVLALREADLEALAACDPRSASERLLAHVASLPVDVDEIESWYETFVQER
ncbi:hypothetical protein [Embleya sp. MST-111070]|uniref:hypothetical protein n=1 Tax=Embleya sp. MST-111070 TaxID=3398231 RepID=UPI003F737EB2